jgi:hypothetical protein
MMIEAGYHHVSVLSSFLTQHKSNKQSCIPVQAIAIAAEESSQPFLLLHNSVAKGITT